MTWLPFTSGTITNMRPSERPRATVTSRSLTTRCFVPRRTDDVSVRDGIDVAMPPRSTTLIVMCVVVTLVALDAVAGEPEHRRDRGIEIDERAQRAVREAVARGAGREHRLHERHAQQRLVGAGDADRDRLGLVLDRVDRPRQLLDHRGEPGGEVLDQRARRADLAELERVRVERDDAGAVAQQRAEPHRGAGVERTVVDARAQAFEEARRERLETVRSARASRSSASRRRATSVSMSARASRSGSAVASIASAAS